MSRTLVLLCLALLWVGSAAPALAERVVVPLDRGWSFQGRDLAGREIQLDVELPHTWNARDAQAGYDFVRGRGVYEKRLLFDLEDKRVFVRFGAVGHVADVSLDGTPLGQHRGGYSAFAFELTPHLQPGVVSTLRVVADNSPAEDVVPLVGDFDAFGGIHRPVKLIVTERACITPLDHASPGVYLRQRQVSAERAEVEVTTKVSNGFPEGRGFEVRTTVLDAAGEAVAEARGQAEIAAGATQAVVAELRMERPRLWNGRADPYLYTARVELLHEGRVLDRVDQPLGLRSFRVDPELGFFLNGEPLKLKGVALHHDRQDRGSAIPLAEQEEDLALILEMGANALRLAHYQHPEARYALADRAGMVVWAEIPFVGVPTFLFPSYHPTEAFHANLRQQLRELIRQNYNHPSVFFWGLFNEQPNPEDESRLPILEELQALAREEDPERLTTAASMLDPDDPIHDVTDTIAWNRYFGWYYGRVAGLGEFLDETHRQFPERRIGISEYGAGASIQQQREVLERPNPFGTPHPENWQGHFHEGSWQAIAERPFVWGSFVWAMFDFTSSNRREGDRPGINDKGLVTHDRRTRKDAFYYYKAVWNDPERVPVLHVTGRRHRERAARIDVKVYSNLPGVSLEVNGQALGESPGAPGVHLWEDVSLQVGNNVVTARAGHREDTVVWIHTDPRMALVPLAADVLGDIVPILAAGAGLLVVLFALSARAEPRSAGRRLARLLFWALLVAYALLWALLLFLLSQGFDPFDR